MVSTEVDIDAAKSEILVIDDDTNFLGYMKELLEGEGYAVATASSGVEGIHEYGENHPSLLITDIIMPEKDGLELIIKVRSLDVKIPIIAITGGEGIGANFLRAAEAFGANKMFLKPFNSAALLSSIQELLEAKDSGKSI